KRRRRQIAKPSVRAPYLFQSLFAWQGVAKPFRFGIKDLFRLEITIWRLRIPLLILKKGVSHLAQRKARVIPVISGCFFYPIDIVYLFLI
ncbi:MAG: hypothetical protein ACU84J_15085, partial [Gammaproteobacteria bacterium]